MTRRSVLAAGAVLAAGCDTSSPRRRRSTPNPDAAVLATAIDSEAQLVATYDAAIARSSGHVQARLRVGRATHAVHLDTMQRAAGARAPTGKAEPVTRLPATLTTSADRLASAAASARLGSTAALLGSVAGSHRAMALSAPRAHGGRGG